VFCIEHRHEKGDGYDLVSNGALAAQSALIVRNHLRLAACDKAWDKSWTAVIKEHFEAAAGDNLPFGGAQQSWSSPGARLATGRNEEA
jgi:hypothetical protein